jgi:hypothetical protein
VACRECGMQISKVQMLSQMPTSDNRIQHDRPMAVITR